jgi:hypothetical protein
MMIPAVFGSSLRKLFVFAFAAMLTCAPTASSAETCSQPLSDGSEPVVRDCIHIARASIGAVSCRDCVCDTNGSGEVSIADALRCLWYVIDAEVTLECPTCDSTTTTTAGTCASCSDVFFHAAGPDELCEASQILHDAMIDCPCAECAGDCAGYCDGDPDSHATRECARCVLDGCRDDVAACLDD